MRVLLLLLLLPLQALAMEQNNLTVLYSLDRLEYWQWASDAEEEDGLEWETSIKAGNGYDFVRLYQEGEQAEGKLEFVTHRLFYQRATTPFWDMQLGIEHQDNKEGEDMDRLALGWIGLAPYFIEVDALLLLGDDDNSSLDLEAGYELMFTQRLKLELSVEALINLQDNTDFGMEKGLASTEFELELGYEIKRELVSYWGLRWLRYWGDTHSALDKAGHRTAEWGWFAGISYWY